MWRLARCAASSAPRAANAICSSCTLSKRNRPLYGLRPVKTTSSAVKGKTLEVDCGTYAMRLARSRGCMVESEAPSKITSPLPGGSSPASNRIKVDLPDPFAPISAPIAPRGSDNETSTTAGNKEYENSKCSASISAPVVEESFGIRKTLRVQRLRKHLRGMANELAGMNH